MRHRDGYWVSRTRKDKLRGGLKRCRNIISKFNTVLVGTIEMPNHYPNDIVQRTVPTANGERAEEKMAYTFRTSHSMIHGRMT